MIKFAVISFPGTNCENENVRAFKRSGMEAEMVLWNDPGLLDGSRCAEFDGYCIAGGFSYEDRGRSGVVAAQDPITRVIKNEADAGKVVLGICNGAQVLVETGLIPGFDNKALAMSLAWNEMRNDGQIIDTGFYNAWAHLKNSAPRGRSAFNDFDELLHIPFAHGEGRFVMSEELLNTLEMNDQIPFKYCDAAGVVSAEYPTTPNGAMGSIAAICNPAGNVMAIMPHPERDPLRNGNLIFQSIKKWIEEGRNTEYQSLGNYDVKDDVREKGAFDLEILVRLIITDNTERTIEEALIRNGFDLHLDRYEYYGIRVQAGFDPKEAVQKIMESGELANLNKHLVMIRIGSEIFAYNADTGLQPKEFTLNEVLIVADQKDFVGQSKKDSLNARLGGLAEEVQYGVLWNVSAPSGVIDEVIASKVLYNPHSMYLMR
ncbi:MAG: phosphoribosylformylglycinamidine synthase I [Candidatus Peregrinibacteria bacterium]|nr:phosphoribosylformylglycinamidine synthase I [Candidatus Peregrinibacteria bacterium]